MRKARNYSMKCLKEILYHGIWWLQVNDDSGNAQNGRMAFYTMDELNVILTQDHPLHSNGINVISGQVR